MIRTLMQKDIYKFEPEISSEHTTVTNRLYRALVVPWKLNLLFSSIAFTSIYYGLVYAIFYSFFEFFPLVYGGFYDADFNISKLVTVQSDQAFVNGDTALKDAGGTGWSQVYRIHPYHIQMDEDTQDTMVRNFKKWMPGNHPVWTCVQIGRLGHDAMRVEIEVSAH
ncbi:hypothetical protein BBP40_001445 [Aspergillus hancockii]|nr:hypothetical protein BBP40_001445 [Aspergillus hancockii]